MHPESEKKIVPAARTRWTNLFARAEFFKLSNKKIRSMSGFYKYEGY